MSLLVTDVLPNNVVITAGFITHRRLMGSGINRGTQKGSVVQREREPTGAFKGTAANVRSCVSYRRFIYESVRIRYHFIAYFRENCQEFLSEAEDLPVIQTIPNLGKRNGSFSTSCQNQVSV